MISRLRASLAAVALVAIFATCTPGATSVPTQAPSTAPAGAIVAGRVHAGPTCPVETVPPDPACADRPVAGAVLVVTTAAGAEVARATSAADGTFKITLPPGDYVLVPQPVAGLMGTAQSMAFRAQGDGAAPAPLDVAYDTGIR